MSFSNLTFSNSFGMGFDLINPPPVVETEESTFGVFGIIQARGQGVSGLISANGQGVLSAMSESFGVSSTMQERGQSVTGTIDETGKGVKGLI